MQYDVVIYEGATGFQQIRPYWDALADHAGYFFQLAEWVEGIPADGLTWYAVCDSSDVVVVGVLRRAVRHFGPVPLHMLGDVQVAFDGWSNHGLPLTSLALANPSACSYHIGQALRSLLRALGKWHVLTLHDLRADSVWCSTRLGRLQESGPAIPILDTRMSSTDFWRGAPDNLRSSLRKNSRKMARVGEHTIVEATTPEAIADHFDRFVALEARGWKRETGAYVRRPETAAFMRRFLVAASSRYRVHIRSLFLNEQAAASQIAIQVKDTLFLLKITYDEEFRSFGPGNLLLADLVSKACDNTTVSRIDCAAGAAAWHARWGMTLTPTRRFIAVNRRTAAGVATACVLRGQKIIAPLHRRAS